MGGEGGSCQTLSSKRSELRRVERVDASEASESWSSRMRVVVYLNLVTKQTNNFTTHKLETAHITTKKAVHKTDQNTASGNSNQKC